MTAIADLLTRAERDRLLERLRELGDLDRLMRQPGTLAAPREDRKNTTTERTATCRS